MVEKKKDIFERLRNGETIPVGDPEAYKMREASFATKKLLNRMNSSTDPGEIRDLLGEIIGAEIDESTALFTPLYINYGEEYAMNNPVWVIRNQSISVEDLIDIKRNHIFTKYIPRNEKLMATNDATVRSTTPYKITETKVTSIKAEKQHDDWLNGGSEFIIYWFFPTKDFALATHKTNQIHFSRKEIKKKTTKNITFVGNYDWDKGQSHNKLKIIEFDPGRDMQYDVKLAVSYKPKDAPTTITGEFSTTIKINNQDDEIMELTLPRTSMFTNDTKIDDNNYQKSFSNKGVTVNVKITGINGIEF